MHFPPELRYTSEHEWARVQENRVTVGITDYAQDALGDVVYVELPQPGARVTQGQPFGVVESVKSVSDLFAPVSGTVTEVNTELPNSPDLINREPYGQGWMIVVEMDDPGQLGGLLTAQQYERHLQELQG